MHMFKVNDMKLHDTSYEACTMIRNNIRLLKEDPEYKGPDFALFPEEPFTYEGFEKAESYRNPTNLDLVLTLLTNYYKLGIIEQSKGLSLKKLLLSSDPDDIQLALNMIEANYQPKLQLILVEELIKK